MVSGDTISVYYDPMIAKLITWGADRGEAAARLMQQALAETAVLGVKPTSPFCKRWCSTPHILPAIPIPFYRPSRGVEKAAIDDLRSWPPHAPNCSTTKWRASPLRPVVAEQMAGA